jgi:hypothetical protein
MWAIAAALALIASPSAGLIGQESAIRQESAVRMVADEGEGAKYWPRWRGPSGQGLAAGSGYPDTWSATQNVLWKTPVPGSGNSSPIVWRDRIFLTTATENGKRLSLLAYRRSDGVRLWETAAPDGRTDFGAHYKNGYASATPATDGERVYVSFGTRGLFAFDMDGKVIWRRDLGPMDAYHGAAGSPLLYKNRIILYQDQSSGSFIAAFDTRTGQQIWRTARDASVGWGTPIAVRVGRPRRDHRQRSAAGARVRPRHRSRALALQREHVRSDSNAGGRLRHGVLRLRPRRPRRWPSVRAARET